MIKARKENIINVQKNQKNVRDLYLHFLKSKENNGRFMIIMKVQIYQQPY